MVQQEDFHWAFLTCRETISFAAALLQNKPLPEREEEVERIISKMGLDSCADTRVGNAFIQGLSGGQKRRLSVAITLLKKLNVIFLDEPTSGLDAASATGVMSFLHDLTKSEGLLTIFTIHQPSTQIYNSFDRVLLLSRGRVAFAGATSGVVPYLDTIGSPLPAMTNPAEYMLELVNPDFADEAKVTSILDKWDISDLNKQAKRDESIYNSLKKPVSSTPQVRKLGSGHINVFLETWFVFKRLLLLTIRDPSVYIGRCIIFLSCNIFFAIIYIKAREKTQLEAIPRMWFLLWCCGVPANMGVVAVFVSNIEFKSVRREVMNGMISPAAYLFSNSVLQIPFMFIFGLFAIGIPMYAIMDYNGSRFPQIWLMYSLKMYAWESIAQMLSVAFDNPLLGVLQYMQLWFAAFLFSGIFLPIDTIVWPFRAMCYFLPYQWAFRSMVYEEFIDQTFSN